MGITKKNQSSYSTYIGRTIIQSQWVVKMDTKETGKPSYSIDDAADSIRLERGPGIYGAPADPLLYTIIKQTHAQRRVYFRREKKGRAGAYQGVPGSKEITKTVRRQYYYAVFLLPSCCCF